MGKKAKITVDCDDEDLMFDILKAIEDGLDGGDFVYSESKNVVEVERPEEESDE